MAVPDTRGSWTLHEGVNKRWNDKNLDNEFRKTWSIPSDTTWQPLSETEQNPSPPGPYCVYEILEPFPVTHMTGLDVNTENQLNVVQLRFTLHAKSLGAESGKVRLKPLVKKVAAAFDPGAGYLDISPDKHVRTIRQGDFSFREGDQEWAWVLQYEILYDAAYVSASKA